MNLTSKQQPRVKLTHEESDFFATLRMRATTDKIGQPLLSYLIFRMVPVAVVGTKTMAIDKHLRVYIDFEYMMEKGISFATEILGHEAWHPLKEHHQREESLPQPVDRDAWNLAADAEINDDIRKIIPKDSIFPESFDEKEDEVAEYYYRVLTKRREDAKKKAEPEKEEPEDKEEDQDKSENESQENEKDKTDSEDNDEEIDNEDSDSEEQDDENSDDNQNNDNGDQGSDGNGEPKEDSNNGDQNSDDVNDSGELTDEKSDNPGDKENGDGDPTDESDSSDEKGETPGDDTSEEQPSGNGTEPSNQDGNDSNSKNGQPSNSTESSKQNSQENQPGGGSEQSDEPGEEYHLPENPHCGTGDEESQEYELSSGEAEGVDDFEMNLILSEIAEAIKDEMQRNPGNVPGNLQLWVENFAKPAPTPWQKILRPALRSTIEWTKKSKIDYRWSTPARKQPMKDVYFPALRSPQIRLLLGVDTSGSHVHLLPRVASEVMTILKKTGIQGRNFNMVSVDTHIKDKPKRINKVSDLNFKGGGGTSMLPFFDLAVKMKKDIDIAVLLTDGGVPEWYKENPIPSINFVVCILGLEGYAGLDKDFKRAEQEMPWAKVIKIEVPKEELI
jgi:predicted metal-dependent peptidase